MDLKQMSDSDLADLEKQVITESRNRSSRRKENVLQQIHELAAKNEISLDDLKGVLRRKRRPSDQIYRNPDDPDKVWRGRGRKPSWLQKKIDEGASMEEFRV